MALVEGFWESFPDIELEPTHLTSNGNYTTVRIEFEATGEGEYLGHDIDGKDIKASEMMLFHVSDGRLDEYWYNWDELGFWEQLGVLERPYPEE